MRSMDETYDFVVVGSGGGVSVIRYVPAPSPSKLYDPSAAVVVVRWTVRPSLSVPVSVTVMPAMPVSGSAPVVVRTPFR